MSLPHVLPHARPPVHPHVVGRPEPIQPSFLDHKAWVAGAVAAGVILGLVVMAATDFQPREMVSDVKSAFEIIIHP